MNRRNPKGLVAELILAVLTCALVTGCQKEEPSPDPEHTQYERVMIYYGCGQNNLDGNMKADIREMTESAGSYVPGQNDNKAILVCYHGRKPSGSYVESGTTYTIWIYRDPSTGSVCRDTLARGEYTTTADKEVMTELLTNIKQKFKSDHYGIVFSGHGTGWMPQDSYKTEEPEEDIWLLTDSGTNRTGRQQYGSYGQERVNTVDYFIDIPEMAEAFPMKMDYIVFDACLMGGVEVAWQMAEVTDIIGFSQAEVMGDGFYYPTMTQHLLVENDPCAVVRETYEYYLNQNSTSVVSCVNCKEMEPLAVCCRDLISKYRTQIMALGEDDVQAFYTGSHPWFFDLKDIFVKAGADESELTTLQEALDKCVIYCAHTNHIRHMVDVNTNCGFSTYLPQLGTTLLNEYYKTLSWNEAVGLVE